MCTQNRLFTAEFICVPPLQCLLQVCFQNYCYNPNRLCSLKCGWKWQNRRPRGKRNMRKWEGEHRVEGARTVRNKRSRVGGCAATVGSPFRDAGVRRQGTRKCLIDSSHIYHKLIQSTPYQTMKSTFFRTHISVYLGVGARLEIKPRALACKKTRTVPLSSMTRWEKLVCS